MLQQRSFAEDDQLQHAEFLANGGGVSDEVDDEDSELGGEKEDKQLLLSDPKAWKVSPRRIALNRG